MTAKVLGSNLAGLVFFQTVNIQFQKNCSLIICLLMFCRLTCHIIELFFFVVGKLNCSCLSVFFLGGCVSLYRNGYEAQLPLCVANRSWLLAFNS